LLPFPRISDVEGEDEEVVDEEETLSEGRPDLRASSPSRRMLSFFDSASRSSCSLRRFSFSSNWRFHSGFSLGTDSDDPPDFFGSILDPNRDPEIKAFFPQLSQCWSKGIRIRGLDYLEGKRRTGLPKRVRHRV